MNMVHIREPARMLGVLVVLGMLLAGCAQMNEDVNLGAARNNTGWTQLEKEAIVHFMESCPESDCREFYWNPFHRNFAIVLSEKHRGGPPFLSLAQYSEEKSRSALDNMHVYFEGDYPDLAQTPLLKVSEIVDVVPVVAVREANAAEQEEIFSCYPPGASGGRNEEGIYYVGDETLPTDPHHLADPLDRMPTANRQCFLRMIQQGFIFTFGDREISLL